MIKKPKHTTFLIFSFLTYSETEENWEKLVLSPINTNVFIPGCIKHLVCIVQGNRDAVSYSGGRASKLQTHPAPSHIQKVSDDICSASEVEEKPKL